MIAGPCIVPSEDADRKGFVAGQMSNSPTSWYPLSSPYKIQHSSIYIHIYIYNPAFRSLDYGSDYWVAVKELKLSYYIGETLLFTIYTHYGNLILSSFTATQIKVSVLLGIWPLGSLGCRGRLSKPSQGSQSSCIELYANIKGV